MSVNIGFLGPLGSFTHQAALAYTQHSFMNEETESKQGAKLVPLSTIAAVFHAVAQGSIDIGIVPVENSTNGAVYPTLDLFADQVTKSSSLDSSSKSTEDPKEVQEEEVGDVVAIGEVYVRVEHCLLAHKPSKPEKGESAAATSSTDSNKEQRSYPNITSIHTHPQAWTQCSRFLSSLSSSSSANIEKHDASSTSRAAELASLDSTGGTAAIASRVAAGIYSNLEILEEGIQDRSDNVTRFLVLKLGRNGAAQTPTKPDAAATHTSDDSGKNENSSKQDGKEDEAQKRQVKSLIAFTIAHTQPGSLASALNAFNKAGLNLSSINTRPSGLEAWGYVFFIEVLSSSTAETTDTSGSSGGDESGLLEKAIKELEAVTGLCRWLGSWESDGVPGS